MKKTHKSPLRGLLRGLAILAIAAPAPLLALNPDLSILQYNCRTWRRNNGLPTTAITAMTQSSDGLLWLSTSQGLVSFDGVKFRVLRVTGTDSIEGKIINSLAGRAGGGLWFGLEVGSFGYFLDGRFHTLERGEGGGPLETAYVVRGAHDGSLLVGGTAFSGRLEQPDKFTSLLPVAGATVYAIHEDGRGRIWIGTADNGLFYWKDGRVHAFPDPALKNSVVAAVTVDQDGKIWVGADGLRCYDPDFQPVPLPNMDFGQPKALLVDSHAVLWIGSSSVGLMRYKDGTFTSLHQSDGLASNNILSLAESEDGSLWVGTENGLSQLSDVKFPIFTTSEGLASNASLAVAASPLGGVWVGTTDGVSHYINGRFETFGHSGADGVTSRWVKCIYAARNGDVYLIGARKNLDRLRDGRVDKSWRKDVWPRAVAEDSRGILVAMEGDLMRIDDDTLVPFRLSDGSAVSLRWINDMLVAADDSVWLAASDGVFQVKDGVIHNLCHDNNLFQSSFLNLYQAGDGSVWGSQVTGIARFKDGAMNVVNHTQGLHEDFVYSMVEDNLGNFWMDSNRGIFRVRASELNAVAEGTTARLHCTVYEGESAVKTTDKAQQEFSGCRTTDGRIWFPSSRGVIMIDPANLPQDSRPPAVSIERVRINGREFDPGESPLSEPGAGNLEFDYLALDFRDPERIRYRYRLDGYETEWIDAGGRRSAFYTNLKPGQYVFQVQACNADGVWNEQGARFALALPQRFYDTLLFRTTAMLVLLGLGTYVWRSQHLRRQQLKLQKSQALLETKVRERTAELTGEIEERKRMEQEIEQVHEQLVEYSRRAGMAEVATGVLHNVGNVLNSVNVSTSVVHRTLQGSEVASLSRVAALLREHSPDIDTYLTKDPKGRLIPGFVVQLAEHLTKEQELLAAEHEHLAKNVEHIKAIVAMQQSYATVSGVLEQVRIADLVEDALQIHTVALVRHGIEVVRDYAQIPPMLVDKHKVMQILVNLVQNAKHAIAEAHRPNGRIIARIALHGADRFGISIEDNGAGIPAGNITRVFSHGFTTRKDGHGFGLHSGANAAHEMGGSLKVESEGPGHGATFTLELPVRTNGGEHE